MVFTKFSHIAKIFSRNCQILRNYFRISAKKIREMRSKIFAGNPTLNRSFKLTKAKIVPDLIFNIYLAHDPRFEIDLDLDF